MSADWATPRAIERMYSMRAEGASASEIAARLGVSKGCITGMLDRLQVPSPNPPVHRPGAHYGPKPKPPVVPAVTPRPVIAAPTPRPTPTPIPSAGDCCWPIAERPYRYCDKPTFGRLPYCEAHAKRSYQSEGWRHRQTVGEPAHASGGDD